MSTQTKGWTRFCVNCNEERPSNEDHDCTAPAIPLGDALTVFRSRETRGTPEHEHYWVEHRDGLLNGKPAHTVVCLGCRIFTRFTKEA